VKLLIVTPSNIEMDALSKGLQSSYQRNSKHILSLIETGVGIPATIFSLTNHLSVHYYDLAIHCGIAGSFSDNYPPGSVVIPYRDQFTDIGEYHPKGFRTLFDMKLTHPDQAPFQDGLLVNPEDEPLPDLQIPKVVSSTVNTLHYDQSGKINHSADIETMENAAFFYTCLMKDQHV